MVGCDRRASDSSSRWRSTRDRRRPNDEAALSARPPLVGSPSGARIGVRARASVEGRQEEPASCHSAKGSARRHSQRRRSGGSAGRPSFSLCPPLVGPPPPPPPHPAPPCRPPRVRAPP